MTGVHTRKNFQVSVHKNIFYSLCEEVTIFVTVTGSHRSSEIYGLSNCFSAELYSWEMAWQNRSLLLASKDQFRIIHVFPDCVFLCLTFGPFQNSGMTNDKWHKPKFEIEVDVKSSIFSAQLNKGKMLFHQISRGERVPDPDKGRNSETRLQGWRNLSPSHYIRGVKLILAQGPHGVIISRAALNKKSFRGLQTSFKKKFILLIFFAKSSRGPHAARGPYVLHPCTTWSPLTLKIETWLVVWPLFRFAWW